MWGSSQPAVRSTIWQAGTAQARRTRASVVSSSRACRGGVVQGSSVAWRGVAHSGKGQQWGNQASYGSTV